MSPLKWLGYCFLKTPSPWGDFPPCFKGPVHKSFPHTGAFCCYSDDQAFSSWPGQPFHLHLLRTCPILAQKVPCPRKSLSHRQRCIFGHSHLLEPCWSLANPQLEPQYIHSTIFCPSSRCARPLRFLLPKPHASTHSGQCPRVYFLWNKHHVCAPMTYYMKNSIPLVIS